MCADSELLNFKLNRDCIKANARKQLSCLFRGEHHKYLLPGEDDSIVQVNRDEALVATTDVEIALAAMYSGLKEVPNPAGQSSQYRASGRAGSYWLMRGDRRLVKFEKFESVDAAMDRLQMHRRGITNQERDAKKAREKELLESSLRHFGVREVA